MIIPGSRKERNCLLNFIPNLFSSCSGVVPELLHLLHKCLRILLGEVAS